MHTQLATWSARLISPGGVVWLILRGGHFQAVLPRGLADPSPALHLFFTERDSDAESEPSSDDQM